MTEPLRYQSQIWAAGMWWICVESYESIHERMRTGGIDMSPDADEDKMRMTWIPPIELTVRTEYGPGRVALSLQGIGALMAIPEDEQPEVEFTAREQAKSER